MGTAGGRRAQVWLIVCVLAAGAVVALATGAWARADAPPASLTPFATGGAGSGRGALSLTATSSTTRADAPVGPPDMTRLLEIADEVSNDGRYVRIGDVAISASPVVTRGS